MNTPKNRIKKGAMFDKAKQTLIDLAIISRNFVNTDWPLSKLQITRQKSQSEARRVLIIACDPDAPRGSMGDLAMLSGIMQAYRSEYPDIEFTIIGTRNHSITVPRIGSVPVIAAWTGRSGTISFHQALEKHDALIGLGADVLDGKYGGALVCRFVSYLNHAAKHGVTAAITGFSFNSSPRRPAIYALSRLSPDVRINVRDEYSLQRFIQATKRHATLCADAAFLMKPADEAPSEAAILIENWRSTGLTPILVNLSAHAFAALFHGANETAVVAMIAQQLAEAAASHKLAYILVPHDTKPQSGDVRMLNRLKANLNTLSVQNANTFNSEDPSEIKAIAKLVDLVITGRMHLAIASLGVGTPIISITYQDKFEGLYRHFHAEKIYMLSAENCVNGALKDRIDYFLHNSARYKELISENKETVQELSKRNIIKLN